MLRLNLSHLLSLSLLILTTSAVAEDGSVSVLSTDKNDTGQQTVLLRHKLHPGQTLRYEVTHIAKTKTRINGTEEIANVHTTSTRAWNVGAASDKEMTFEHVIETVAMTQQNGEKDEIRWDSQSGEEPPETFKVVASQIGSSLASVTINPQGQEVRREDHSGSKASLGMGTLTLALPAGPVAIGGSWSVPTEVKARTEDGLVKTIKIRQLYTLKKVKAGVATLSIKSETLTPIDEEALRAQVVQQLSNGTIRFDIDNGHLLSKELDWDESVVGFQGAGSMMEYRARMSEKLIDGDASQATVKAAAKAGDSDKR